MTFKAEFGEHIGHAVFRAIATAVSEGGPVTFDFNEVPVTVTFDSNARTVVSEWHAEMARRTEAYRQSPEGIAAAAARSAQITTRQATVDRCMSDLAALDFTDLGAVLRWIEGIQDATDDVDVRFNRSAILHAFGAHGFEPNAFVGRRDEVDSSPDAMARWIIGQALDGLDKVGAIHHLVHGFIAQWRERTAA